MTEPLANRPLERDIVLTRGADLVTFWDAGDGVTFAPLTTAKVHVTKNQKTDEPELFVWDCTVEGGRIDLRVEHEDGELDEVGDRYRYRLLVTYPDEPATTHCRFRGNFIREQ